MYDIITIGDAMRDIFIFPALEDMEKPVSDDEIDAKEHFDKFLVFGLGDKIHVSDTSFCVGGTAANVAVALKKLGFKTKIISAVGSDNTANEIIQELSQNKLIWII